MHKLITSGVAALGVLGPLAAAGPALASTGHPGAVTIDSYCPSGGGWNGDQESASGLFVTDVSGTVEGTAAQQVFGSCWQFKAPAANPSRVSVFNPKAWTFAPGGTPDGESLTLGVTGQVTLTRTTDAANQVLYYNGDGTWSFASNPNMVLDLPGPGRQVTVKVYNPSDVLPGEDLSYIS